MNYKLRQGDNLELLKKLPDNSIDALITDAPYGLSFMNKKWDYDVPSVELWKEVYRVLKPGGHVLSFGGTRTYHRMVVNIEDAGFEIRDQIMWLYGSGFPKSHNIGKAINKIDGVKFNEKPAEGVGFMNRDGKGGYNITKNQLIQDGESSDRARKWEGWGTALKPAVEPICLARKPLGEKSVAENVLKWKTGGINIDGCRVGYQNETDKENAKPGSLNATGKNSMFGLKSGNEQNNEGRFPTNIILECLCDDVIKGDKGDIKLNTREAGNSYNNYNDGKGKVITRIENYGDKGDFHTNPDCPCRLMDDQSGVSKSSPRIAPKESIKDPSSYNTGVGGNSFLCDEGGASRFFYQAKVSKKERNLGLDGFEVEILTSTIKLLLKTDYNNKNFIWEKEDLKTTPVDTDKSHQKDTEEYGSQQKEDKLWSTELFGRVFTDQFLTDIKSIILMATNSTTIYQTLNSLIQKNIKTNTQELSGLMVKDIKLVSDVENKNIKMSITLQKKDGYSQSVSLVELNEVWRLSVKENKCSHPTLKPINLMAYLCRLITPKGGTILDPYMGSGSTGIAALLEGFNFIGMDLDPEYVKIAEARISNYEEYREFIKNK